MVVLATAEAVHEEGSMAEVGMAVALPPLHILLTVNAGGDDAHGCRFQRVPGMKHLGKCAEMLGQLIDEYPELNGGTHSVVQKHMDTLAK